MAEFYVHKCKLHKAEKLFELMYTTWFTEQLVARAIFP